jgi:hypothetical protein
MTISPAAPSIVKGLTTQFTVSGTFSDNTTQDLTFDATWASNAPAVATVSDAAGSKGFAQALIAGTTTINATFGGVSGSTLLTVTEPVLQSITVTPNNAKLLTLSTSTFSYQATGHYSNGTTADITSQAVWVSSGPDIATIAATGGAATGLTVGTTTISATLNGVPGATNLTVTGGNLLSIAISPTAPTLVKDTVARITANGSFSDNSFRDITGVVVWSTTDPALATVTKAGGNLAWLNANGVTPVGIPAKVTATVTTPLGTVSSLNPTNLTVTAPALQSIAITPINSLIAANTSTRFTVTATFDNLTTQDVTYSATWSSSNDTIATVGVSGIAKGRVSAVSTGSTTISAAYGGKSITAPVTVTVPTNLQASGITSSGAASPGNQFKFTAKAVNGQDVTEDTTWSLDDPNVAVVADQVNQPGQVFGVVTGTTTLRATFGVDKLTRSVIVQ